MTGTSDVADAIAAPAPDIAPAAPRLSGGAQPPWMAGTPSRDYGYARGRSWQVDIGNADTIIGTIVADTEAEARERAAYVLRLVNSRGTVAQALEAARRQLVALNGEPQDDSGDRIQRAVLDTVDEALALIREGNDG